MRNYRIPLSQPDVTELEEKYLLNAFRSGWGAAGPDLGAFEAGVAARAGVEYGVALSSGTAALHLGLLALGVKPGDRVVTSSLTFAATANAIRYVGAEPVFVDSEAESGNMDPGLIHLAISNLRSQGLSIGAIVPVDLFGKAADYTRIEQMAAEAGIPVLADAAESFGSAHRGRAVGGFGHAAAVSFNCNKVMTTSGGGMLLTDSESLAARARYLAAQARQPAAHYQHTEIGYNYRLSNLLAAVGCAQLTRLESMIAKRRYVREMYEAMLSDVPGVRILGRADDSEDNCWLSAIVVDPAAAGWSAAELGEALAVQGIETRPVWKPMHLQPAHRGSAAYLNGTSDWLFENGVVLPSGSALTPLDCELIQSALCEFLGGVSFGGAQHSQRRLQAAL